MILPVHVTSKDRGFILGIRLLLACVLARDKKVQFPETETSEPFQC